MSSAADNDDNDQVQIDLQLCLYIGFEFEFYVHVLGLQDVESWLALLYTMAKTQNVGGSRGNNNNVTTIRGEAR